MRSRGKRLSRRQTCRPRSLPRTLPVRSISEPRPAGLRSGLARTGSMSVPRRTVAHRRGLLRSAGVIATVRNVGSQRRLGVAAKPPWPDLIRPPLQAAVPRQMAGSCPAMTCEGPVPYVNIEGARCDTREAGRAGTVLDRQDWARWPVLRSSEVLVVRVNWPTHAQTCRRSASVRQRPVRPRQRSATQWPAHSGPEFAALQRQPSAGATWDRIASMICAL